MTNIMPKAVEESWLHSYIDDTLLSTPAFRLDTPAVDIKLDQNESPYDWPQSVKERVAQRVIAADWNRYPSAYGDELAEKIGAYAGVAPGCTIISPGSNYLCAIALTLFGRQCPGEVWIARPSFALYESHCRYDGIPFKPWLLTDDLEYDLAALDQLPPRSLVVFASPNNPVGNSLARDDFAKILAAHPDTLFLADEAYYEYTAEPYTPLLAEHSNLMIIRTFSKTLGSAGVRVGYALGHPRYIEQMRKLRLPFLLNHFAIAAATEILDAPEMVNHRKDVVAKATQERERVTAALTELSGSGGYTVKPSHANFVLLRWPNNDRCELFYQGLIRAGILVRNVSKGPGLHGCLRITIGHDHENDQLIKAFQQLSTD